jgi:Holliday junction resolvase
LGEGKVDMAQPRRKGKRYEYEVLWELLNIGVDAKRIPLSGSSWIKGDLIIVTGKSRSFVAECKRRARLPFSDWLKGVDLLFAREDRGETMVMMRMDLFSKLLKAYVKRENEPTGNVSSM